VELLPVIYWSLFSVGILALVVTVISFIIFKFRKKYGHIPSDEVLGKYRNKKVKVTNPDKKPKTEIKHHPKVQTKSRQKSNSSRPGREVPASSKAELYKRPTRDSQKKRVEIINPNLENEPTKEKYSKKNNEYHSLRVDSKQNDWN
jgi:hypothetical protein